MSQSEIVVIPSGSTGPADYDNIMRASEIVKTGQCIQLLTGERYYLDRQLVLPEGCGIRGQYDLATLGGVVGH